MGACLGVKSPMLAHHVHAMHAAVMCHHASAAALMQYHLQNITAAGNACKGDVKRPPISRMATSNILMCSVHTGLSD